MNCPQARFLLYAHLDRELSRNDAKELARHLALCGPCAARADSARGLIGSMRDIVWAIDPRRDDFGSVIFRIRQFASDVLEGQGIKWEFRTPLELEKIKLGPDQRRHVLLFFKEAINNVAQHANCDAVWMSIDVTHHQLIGEVRDDGRGFAPAPADGRGGHGNRAWRRGRGRAGDRAARRRNGLRVRRDGLTRGCRGSWRGRRFCGPDRKD